MVVAEGIETVEELDAVTAAGARLGQGYLLARPAFPPLPVTWPART
jgi:EAL domain-containing protein (putative c-di-GMP-specific phosphodiesterase class I)